MKCIGVVILILIVLEVSNAKPQYNRRRHHEREFARPYERRPGGGLNQGYNNYNNNPGLSGSAANANAASQSFGAGGLSGSASSANAASQSFNINTPFGNFGASSSNAQSFGAGK